MLPPHGDKPFIRYLLYDESARKSIPNAKFPLRFPFALFCAAKLAAQTIVIKQSLAKDKPARFQPFAELTPFFADCVTCSALRKSLRQDYTMHAEKRQEKTEPFHGAPFFDYLP